MTEQTPNPPVDPDEETVDFVLDVDLPADFDPDAIGADGGDDEKDAATAAVQDDQEDKA